MKKIVAGIVAHVDAGKTTLSEGLLYRAGEIRALGRVDKGSAFLDPDALEKRRGITINTHQASLAFQNLSLTLLDTPGHVDFAAQTEQVLSVLDYAVLVISATEGIQGHTRTLWRLLDRYHVPTFIFINKMDAPGVDADALLATLKTNLSAGCVAFTTPLSVAIREEIAVQDETVLADYLANETLSDQQVRQLIQQRKIFPCYFGSALKLTGLDELLTGLNDWTQEREPQPKFSARVFKVSHDVQGERLSWIRVTGGTLSAKQLLLPDEKANQLRRYNGAKFTTIQEAKAGEVVAVTGLTQSYPGQGLGDSHDAAKMVIQPVMTYAIDLQERDPHVYLPALNQLADEDANLHVTWSSELQELRVQIMGQVQLEILQERLQEMIHLPVIFTQGQIMYRETITRAVEGVGHFEPLRHYAEVHLRLEPLPAGSGLIFASNCSLEVLDKNWQHQVLTALRSKEHVGVLIGAPLTDVKITLIGGRASNVHSVGGDFRQAAWRAVRQGLMMLRANGDCDLLEPWYSFRLVVPEDQIGRAMTDIERMHGHFDTPLARSNGRILTGAAPVANMQDYAKEVQGYTRGQGEFECSVAGYQSCQAADQVVFDRRYDPKADLPNTPDSVFCAHGAGYPVDWDQVPNMAHYPYQTKM
ncbi:GTP-binding protein [Furfurilactobacillus curtus]|uniref:Elongation factor G n=1 Tax=Furfurilactobacillus curtus TaxID=1746200 RepID=A0ABQ5JMC8_9LACO